MKRVAIIGAGAAGCFCAVQLRRMAPKVAITLFEAGPKPMAKLSITGGGRCNLTNSFQGIITLEDIIETILGMEIIDENDTVTDMQQYAKDRWLKRQKQYKQIVLPEEDDD